MSYRTQADRIEDEPEPLPKGPAAKCPACGGVPLRQGVGVYQDRTPSIYGPASDLDTPRACAPLKRIRVGLIRKCKVIGSHLHERCRACRHEWLTAFAGG